MRKPLNSFLLYPLVALLVFSLAGCSSTRRALNLETSAEITLDATKNVNPNTDGKASPLVIRVLKLRDDRQFKQEDFLNLFENAKSRLGDDLIESVRLKEIAPGEERVEVFKLTPEIRYLGILGEYIRYEDAQAKQIILIEPHKTNKVELEFGRLKIVIKD